MDSSVENRVGYFFRNNFWKITEILLNNSLEVTEEISQSIESWLGKILNQIDIKNGEINILKEDWQKSWYITQLLHCLHNVRKETSFSHVQPTLDLRRQELLLQYIIRGLDCKTLINMKDVSHFTDKKFKVETINQIPTKINKNTYHVLCKALINSPCYTLTLLSLLKSHYLSHDISFHSGKVYDDSMVYILEKLRYDKDFGENMNSLIMIVLLSLDFNREMEQNISESLKKAYAVKNWPFRQLLIITSYCKCSKLYQKLIVLHDKMFIRERNKINFNDVKTVQKIYTNVIKKNGIVCIQEIFTRIIKGRTHWIEDIVVLCSQLILNSELHKVEECMLNPLYGNLWLLIIMNLWKQSSGNLKILSIICPILDVCKKIHPDIYSKLCEVLYKIKFTIDWLNSQNNKNETNLNTLLSLMAKHKILYVIKNVIDLKKIEYIKLEEFIYKMNTFGSFGINLEEDMNILKGFTVLHSTFNIILQAAKIDKSLRRVRNEIQHEEIMKQYNENVKAKLKSLIYIIEDLQPTLRLEILEDLFSLLFLRQDDMDKGLLNDFILYDKDTKYPTKFTSFSKQSKKILLTSSSFPPAQTCKKKNNSESGQRKLSIKSVKDDARKHFLCNFLFIEDLITIIIKLIPPADSLTEYHFRLCRLNQAVNDAKWKINLLANARVCLRDKYLNIQNYEDFWYIHKVDTSGSDEDLNESYTPRKFSERCGRSNSLGNSIESYYSNLGELKCKFPTNNKGYELHNHKSCCGVFNIMLSSPSNLICFFLAKGDTMSSENIVQKFALEESPLNFEIQFLKLFNELKEKLLFTTYTKNYTHIKKENTIQAINEAAAAGFFVTTIASLLNNFFSTAQLPVGFGDKGELVLDLALTFNFSNSHSKYLLNLANDYFSNSSHIYSELFETLHKKLHNIVMAEEHLYEGTIPLLLIDPLFPLHNYQTFKNIYMFWKVFKKSLEALHSSLNSSEYQESSSLYITLSICGSNYQGLMKTKRESVISNNFQDLFLIYTNILYQLVKNSIFLMDHGGSYQEFEDHLKFETNFSLINMNLKQLFGTMVFVYNSDPEKLDVTTQCLGIDLVQYLVQNCTPRFYVTNHIYNSPLIVLNKHNDQNKDFQGSNNPYHVTTYLLEKLVKVLDGSNIHKGGKENLTNNPDVLQILQETSILAKINLDCLSSEDQNLAFLINLSNLMWLHGIILLEYSEPGFGLVSSSLTLRTTTSSSVGYLVGELGFVSITRIWATLLPSSLLVHNIIGSVSPVNIQVSSDPRVLFSLCQPYKLTPKLQVFNSELLDSQLEICMQDYIKNTIRITNSTIHIPVLLHTYVNYLINSQSPESDVCQDSVSNSASGKNSSFKECLKEVLMVQLDISGINIEVMKETEFCIRLNYSSNICKISIHDVHQPYWKDCVLSQSLMQFFTKKSHILSMLIEKLHLIEEAEETGVIKTSLSAFERFLNSKSIIKLAEILEDSQIMAVLQSFIPEKNLWSWFDQIVITNNWEAILEMINLLTDYQLKTDSRLTNFKDDILVHLSCQPNGWKFCLCIKNELKMASSALLNLNKWPGNGCIDVLKTLISSQPKLPYLIHAKAQEMLNIVTLCQKIANVITIGHWKFVHESDPWNILELLLDSDNVCIALEWANYNKIPQGEQTSACLFLVRCFILGLFEKGLETDAVQILSNIETDQAIQICEHIVNIATSLNSLQQTSTFLMQSKILPSQKNCFLDIGVQMLAALPWQEQLWYRKLINQPILFVEQLLMNTKISTLDTILLSLKTRISKFEPGSPLSPQCLDALFRRYASKALDISIRKKTISQNKNLPFNQTNNRDKFKIPDKAPDKTEWIPNDDVSECMCCSITVFSMFNRRHHCRRCGRVVCASCSKHRMKIAGYGNVTVRVCNECLEYIKPKTIHTSLPHDFNQWSSNYEGKLTIMDKDNHEPEWILTNNIEYNETVRGEFMYAHAPSVSLCMSILKLHFESIALIRFLITTIEEMMQLLRPNIPGVLNPEVDYIFVVRMLRSLVDFARLCTSRQGVTSYGAEIEHILSEINFLDLLVSSHGGCTLLPSEPLRGHTKLRQLRENLLEHELFTLALEVSTKAGLDYGSVWSAWGKACLKAGSWKEAREKFSHCSLHKKEIQHGAILTDIIQLLQNNPHSSDLKFRLSNLQNLADCKSLDKQCYSRLNQNVLEECLYYLKTYGSHGQLLQFYLHQHNLKAAIRFVIESSVDAQVFLDTFFLPCLRLGLMMQVYEEMIITDKSLKLWKNYIGVICAHFDRQKMYYSLYETQIWMNDHIRAAITCTYFYTNKTRNYRDLNSNLKYLDLSTSHLLAALKSTPGYERKDLVMNLKKEEIIQHLSTIKLQIEVTQFLASRCLETSMATVPPTLFGNNEQRSRVAIMILICGENLCQSLLLANRIIDEWNLDKYLIFCNVGEKFVEKDQIADMRKLVDMLGNEVLSNEVILSILRKQPSKLDDLIYLINDVSMKITAYIECGQLKSAYLLAVQSKLLNFIPKILEASELLNQPLIKKICLQLLYQLDEKQT